MRVEKVDLVHVRIPLHVPFRISSGVVSEKDAVIVIAYSEGLIGYGEASPMAGTFYSPDSPESTWQALSTEILPRVLRRKSIEPSDLDEVFSQVPGNSFAKAGLEGAIWDLTAQRMGVPLFQLLGGSREVIPSGLGVGIFPTLKELLDSIERHLVEGYKRIKIKIEPGWDEEPVREVRRRFGGYPLMVDANAAYRREDISLFERLDDFDLVMFEQPLKKDDLEGHAILQSKVRTPVCLDESAEDVVTVSRAIELGSCRIINIKIQRMGGLSKSKELHDLCHRAGIPVWAGTMPELGVGSVETIHLATLPDFFFPTDVESSARWFVDDLIEPWIEVSDGLIKVPTGIGYGVQIKESKIKEYSVRRQTFS